MGPTAVSYICSKDQGLQLSQGQVQGQQEQEGGAGEPALVEEGGQPALQGQSQVSVGFQGGLSQGQSWFEAWEGESRQEGGGVVEGVARQVDTAVHPGPSQDHLSQQGPQEEAEQEDRVKQAKEVQAGIMTKLTRWLGGCQ